MIIEWKYSPLKLLACSLSVNHCQGKLLLKFYFKHITLTGHHIFKNRNTYVAMMMIIIITYLLQQIINHRTINLFSKRDFQNDPFLVQTSSAYTQSRRDSIKKIQEKNCRKIFAEGSENSDGLTMMKMVKRSISTTEMTIDRRRRVVG